MKLIRNLKTSTLVFGMALLGLNCSDSGNDSGSATIMGKTETTNQKVVSNNASSSLVTAAYVTSSGSIQTIKGTEVNTSATGEFELAVDADAYQNIVIEGTSEAGVTTRGFVATSLENGSSYTIKPLNVESTAETNIFSELVTSGKSNDVLKSEIEVVVTANTATNINNNQSSAASIATALSNSARVRAEYFSDRFGNEAEAKSEMVINAMINAQVELESKLNTSNSVEAREQAYVTFSDAFINAYLEAEMETSSAAKLVEMWGRVFINSTSSFSTEMRNEMNTQVSLLTAAIIDTAVRTEVEATEAGNATKNTIAQAGLTLKSEIKASSGSESEIKAIFDTYHDEVRAALENDDRFSATAIIAVDSDINSTTGAKSSFESSISATVSANLVLSIYDNFFSSVESTVESNFEDSDVNIEALSELMILINTAS